MEERRVNVQEEVQERVADLFQIINAEQERLQAERLALEEERVRFEQTKLQLQEMYAIPDNIVQLNVGGVKISTLRTTLTRFPQSLLGAMFSGVHPITKDRKGRYFLDRSADLFQHVLGFLRMGKLPTFASNQKALAFEAELEFWGLKEEADAVRKANYRAVLHEEQMQQFAGYPVWDHLVPVGGGGAAGGHAKRAYGGGGGGSGRGGRSRGRGRSSEAYYEDRHHEVY